MVGASNSACRSSRACSVWRIVATTCTASSEWPPRSKKSSWMPIGAMPNWVRQISASACSVALAGAT